MSFIVDKKRGFDGIPMSARTVSCITRNLGPATSMYRWFPVAPFTFVNRVYIRSVKHDEDKFFTVYVHNTYSVAITHQLFTYTYKGTAAAGSTANNESFDVNFPVVDVLGIRIWNRHAVENLVQLGVFVELRQNREGKV